MDAGGVGPGIGDGTPSYQLSSDVSSSVPAQHQHVEVHDGRLRFFSPDGGHRDLNVRVGGKQVTDPTELQRIANIVGRHFGGEIGKAITQPGMPQNVKVLIRGNKATVTGAQGQQREVVGRESVPVGTKTKNIEKSMSRVREREAFRRDVEQRLRQNGCPEADIKGCANDVIRRARKEANTALNSYGIVLDHTLKLKGQIPLTDTQRDEIDARIASLQEMDPGTDSTAWFALNLEKEALQKILDPARSTPPAQPPQTQDRALPPPPPPDDQSGTPPASAPAVSAASASGRIFPTSPLPAIPSSPPQSSLQSSAPASMPTSTPVSPSATASSSSAALPAYTPQLPASSYPTSSPPSATPAQSPLFSPAPPFLGQVSDRPAAPPRTSSSPLPVPPPRTNPPPAFSPVPPAPGQLGPSRLGPDTSSALRAAADAGSGASDDWEEIDLGATPNVGGERIPERSVGEDAGAIWDQRFDETTPAGHETQRPVEGTAEKTGGVFSRIKGFFGLGQREDEDRWREGF